MRDESMENGTSSKPLKEVRTGCVRGCPHRCEDRAVPYVVETLDFRFAVYISSCYDPLPYSTPFRRAVDLLNDRKKADIVTVDEGGIWVEYVWGGEHAVYELGRSVQIEFEALRPYLITERRGSKWYLDLNGYRTRNSPPPMLACDACGVSNRVRRGMTVGDVTRILASRDRLYRNPTAWHPKRSMTLKQYDVLKSITKTFFANCFRSRVRAWCSSACLQGLLFTYEREIRCEKIEVAKTVRRLLGLWRAMRLCRVVKKNLSLARRRSRLAESGQVDNSLISSPH